MISGVINVYKEAGFTSFDVIAVLRKIIGQKKIGHTGTLDPDAVGVLPVCLGKATRLCQFLTDETKSYEAVLLLGKTTDTQDISGAVLSEQPVEVSPEETEAAIRSFEGPGMQIPPMYSALKQNGKKLYELARAGKVVERQARPVHFYEIKILSMDLPRVRILVTCSKGTYIRTLCHDIGAALGCGGCMESLKRTRVGRFTAEEALTLDQIRELQKDGRLMEAIVPVDRMFEQYQSLVLKKEADVIGHNGGAFGPEETEGSDEFTCKEMKSFRVYDSEKQFIGIYQYQPQKGLFTVEKMFYEVC